MKANVFCSIGVKSLMVLIGLFLLFSTSCKKDPAVYDFKVFGGMIMQNQNAMKTLANNGWNVFEFKK